MDEKVITYSLNTASLEAIYNHLLECDENFIPPLSDKVDIYSYSKKIKEFASTIEAWQDKHLIGLIAIYCNDETKNCAFITNVSVLTNFNGKGVASLLMKNTIINIKKLGIKGILLEVDKNNTNAINLYKRYNFEINELKENLYKMKLNINHE